PPWKIVGLAGIAGVAATGVVIAGQRRVQRDYEPDELRERLHGRLAAASANDLASAAHTEGPAANRWWVRLRSAALRLPTDHFRRAEN
ncbi:MAG: hypothetical protein ACLP50_15220, partial [Solirubrobacteraceae bacterium]